MSLNQAEPVFLDPGNLPPLQLEPRVDRSELVAGNTRFAVALYKQLAEENQGNLTVSPISVSLALCMAYAGARGNTEAELKDTLNLPLRGKELAAAAGRLQEELSVFDGSCGLELRIANSLWGQTGRELQLEFLETLRAAYKSEFGELDFAARMEESCARINSWVEEHTAGRIRDLVSPRSLGEAVRMVLVNAVYFNCAWADKFPPGATETAPFWTTPESSVEAQLMRRTDSCLYAESPLWQAVSLPYVEGYFSMIVLLPKHKGWLSEFEESLDAGFLTELDKALAHREVEIHLPRFRIEGEFDLVEVLMAMGIHAAFSMRRADFSGITTSERIFIGKVLHKTFMDVHERGTEAAAATAVAMPLGAAPGEPEEPVVFRADHPFIFLLRDERTGSVLFMGRLADPGN
jgi:serpin B